MMGCFFRIDELLDDGAGRLRLLPLEPRRKAIFLPFTPPLALISSAAIVVERFHDLTELCGLAGEWRGD